MFFRCREQEATTTAHRGIEQYMALMYKIIILYEAKDQAQTGIMFHESLYIINALDNAHFVCARRLKWLSLAIVSIYTYAQMLPFVQVVQKWPFSPQLQRCLLLHYNQDNLNVSLQKLDLLDISQ